MKKINIELIKKHYIVILFLIVYFSIISYRILQKPPFYDWDESIYAQVGREMIRAKSFFVPLWQGKPWLDKPPIPSLFYGLVQLVPIAPEISTRLATLILSCFVLLFQYALAYRITKQKIPALLTVIITAFLPIFFQRSQALNVDVFLLLGWLGYVLWYENMIISTLFLLLAVLSKSLLGFFPPLLFTSFYVYSLATKQIDKKHFVSLIKKVAIQLGVSSLWFIGMMLIYKYPFIQYQFIDSHFKRVTASIEQHFGQRTFYVTVLIDQFKLLLIPALISLLYFAYSFFTKKRSVYPTFLAVFFVPWFVFLNLTKTKIEWYIYPVLPQFAFLASYPLTFLKKKPLLLILSFATLLWLFFFTITPIKMLLTRSFSSLEDHQLIARDAKKNRCDGLYVLVDSSTRSSYATLKSMDLVVSTTTWWGNHPSIAYYADTTTSNIYDLNEAKQKFDNLLTNACMIVVKDDVPLLLPSKQIVRQISDNKTYALFIAK